MNTRHDTLIRVVLYGGAVILLLALAWVKWGPFFQWEEVLPYAFMGLGLLWLLSLTILSVVQIVALVRGKALGQRRWIIAGLVMNLVVAMLFGCSIMISRSQEWRTAVAYNDSVVLEVCI